MTSQTASRALALWYHLGLFVCMHLTPFQTHTSHAHLLFHPLHLFALSWINCYFSPPFLSGQFLCSFMLPLPSPLLTPSLPQMLNHPNYALFFSYPCASLFHPSIHSSPLPSICFTFPQYELFASSSSCLWVNYSSIYAFLHLSHSPFLTHSSLSLSGCNHLGEYTAPCWKQRPCCKAYSNVQKLKKQHIQFCPINTGDLKT